MLSGVIEASVSSGSEDAAGHLGARINHAAHDPLGSGAGVGVQQALNAGYGRLLVAHAARNVLLVAGEGGVHGEERGLANSGLEVGLVLG